MRRSRSGAGLLCGLLALAAAGPWAGEARAEVALEDAAVDAAKEDQGLLVRRPNPMAEWHRGRIRPFFSASIDLGFIYFRPRASLGYGKPFSTWAGIDANPIISDDGVGVWIGLRAKLPNINMKAGARYFYAWRTSMLAPQESYDRLDIEDQSGPRSQYWSLEAEVTGWIPAGPGRILAEFGATSVVGVPRGWYVHDHILDVVVKPPYVLRLRTGYALSLHWLRVFNVGLVVEGVSVPKRDLWVLRVGALLRLPLFKNLEARITILPSVASRDSIGAAGGDNFELGVRYRWATGVPFWQ
jgi:hypothetical protein